MDGSFFKWDINKYGLNIAKMDHEHQDIIDKMNSLFKTYHRQAPKKEVQQIFDDLIIITAAHFADEEEFFNQINDYSDKTMTHRGLHSQLLHKLKFYYDEYSRTSLLTSEFFNFLKMWLQAHICGIDTQYAKFVNKKGA